ncbi:MAG: helix-turn-helix domain-containing protein [Candidatus Delongbacteria bacterium]
MNKELKAIQDRLDKAALFMREMDNRLRTVEQVLGDLHRDYTARMEREAEANRPPTPRKPRVVRTPGGKVRDPLLSALAARKADIGLNTRQLAGLLGYPRKTVSNWLNRDRVPRHPEDRVRIQEWIALADTVPPRVHREWREETES